MQWNESLSTGIKEIDEQHKELINRVNQVLDACKQRKGKEVVDETLVFLSTYVIQHFQAEEQIQRANNYPKYNHHKALHDQLITQINQLKNQFDQDGASLTVMTTLNRTLVQWLLDHIKKEDMDISRFIERK